jgi:hypothetical protein
MGDTLILLPQYPSRFASQQNGIVFAIPKGTILSYILGDMGGALLPKEIQVEAPGLAENVAGFEGFEALTFSGDRVYMTIESRPEKKMLGFVIAGTVHPDQDVVLLALESLKPLAAQAELSNYSDEAILVYQDKVITFYEAWGARVNPNPVAHIFDQNLNPGEPWQLPNIEYRITDVTKVDEAGRFWAINYLYPGDLEKLDPAEDELVRQYGQGPSHSQSEIVERLVEFQIIGEKIIRTQTPPIQLILSASGEARNWEGIVRLEGLGFLIATDRYPQTILGFVPYP